MKTFLKVALIVLVIINVCNLTAEENKEILDDYKISKTESELIFTNNKTKEIVKTINLEMDNPYIQKYGKKSGKRYYKLNNKQNDFREISMSKKLTDYYANIEKKTFQPVDMYTNANVKISRNNKYAAIFYNFSIGYSGEDPSLYNKAFYKIFDATGNVLNEIELKNRAGGSFEISENGDYIGTEYRKVDNNFNFHRGYIVIEVSSGNIVTEDKTPKDTDYSVSGCAKHPDYNQMFFNMKSIDIYYSFTYDFDDKKTFSKKFPRNDIRFKERLKDGIIRKAKHDKGKSEFVPFTEFEIKEWEVDR